MEEQTTWKGHSFTLVVFAGIVVLCSIFFILGTLVGRAQGQKMAAAAAMAPAAKTDTKSVLNEDKPDFTFYDSVKKEEPPVLTPSKPDPAPPIKADSREAAPEPRSKPGILVNYQISAVRKSSDAEKLLDQLKKRG